MSKSINSASYTAARTDHFTSCSDRVARLRLSGMPATLPAIEKHEPDTTSGNATPNLSALPTRTPSFTLPHIQYLLVFSFSAVHLHRRSGARGASHSQQHQQQPDRTPPWACGSWTCRREIGTTSHAPHPHRQGFGPCLKETFEYITKLVTS